MSREALKRAIVAIVDLALRRQDTATYYELSMVESPSADEVADCILEEIDSQTVSSSSVGSGAVADLLKEYAVSVFMELTDFSVQLAEISGDEPSTVSFRLETKANGHLATLRKIQGQLLILGESLPPRILNRIP
jgi:hypothetical protein